MEDGKRGNLSIREPRVQLPKSKKDTERYKIYYRNSQTLVLIGTYIEGGIATLYEGLLYYEGEKKYMTPSPVTFHYQCFKQTI